MRPSEIVTGSIRIRMRRTFESRQSARRKLTSASNGPAEAVRRVLEVPDEDRELDHRAGEDADRVRVDLVLLRERRRQADEDGDDHDVPEERRDRVGAEAVVGVEDADDHPGRAQEDDDREEDARERDGQVGHVDVLLRARRAA